MYKFDLVYLCRKCIYIAALLSQNFNISNVVKGDESVNDIIYTIKLEKIKLSKKYVSRWDIIKY